MSEAVEIINQDGALVGPFRQPRNLHQQTEGSIHNDAVATKLGFRGGTVAGIIHHEQFAPLLLSAFGQRWFEQGSISMYYLHASTNEENVQAFIQQPTEGAEDVQVDAWMEHESGFRVLEGTVSVGSPPDKTYVRRKFEARRDPGETRILKDVVEGEMMPERTTKVIREAQDERLLVTTHVLDWYKDESPWGGAICTPVTMFRLLNAGLNLRGKLGSAAVGLYGAIEVNVTNGPLFVEKQYSVQGKILARGETPKSEYLWWESKLKDDSGKEVANMLMMNRWMKASSELYQ